jgi:hypothetical protein
MVELYAHHIIDASIRPPAAAVLPEIDPGSG